MAEIPVKQINGKNYLTVVEDDGSKLITYYSELLDKDSIFRVLGLSNIKIAPTYEKTTALQSAFSTNIYTGETAQYEFTIPTDTGLGASFYVTIQRKDDKGVFKNHSRLVQNYDSVAFDANYTAVSIMEFYYDSSTNTLKINQKYIDSIADKTNNTHLGDIIVCSLYPYTEVGWDKELEIKKSYFESRVKTVIAGIYNSGTGKYEIEKLTARFAPLVDKYESSASGGFEIKYSPYIALENIRLRYANINPQRSYTTTNNFDTQDNYPYFDRLGLVNRIMHDTVAYGSTGTTASSFEDIITRIKDRVVRFTDSMEKIISTVDGFIYNGNTPKSSKDIDYRALAVGLLNHLSGQTNYGEYTTQHVYGTMKRIVNNIVVDSSKDNTNLRKDLPGTHYLNDLNKKGIYDHGYRAILDTEMLNYINSTYTWDESYNDDILGKLERLSIPGGMAGIVLLESALEKTFTTNKAFIDTGDALSAIYSWASYRALFISIIMVIIDILVSEMDEWLSILGGDFIFTSTNPASLDFKSTPALVNAGELLNSYAPLYTSGTEFVVDSKYKVEAAGTNWGSFEYGNPDFSKTGWQNIYHFSGVTPSSVGDYTNRHSYIQQSDGGFNKGEIAVELFTSSATLECPLPFKETDSIAFNAYQYRSNNGASIVPIFSGNGAIDGSIATDYTGSIKKADLTVAELQYLTTHLEFTMATINSLILGSQFNSTVEAMMTLFGLCNYRKKYNFDPVTWKSKEVATIVDKIEQENSISTTISTAIPDKLNKISGKFKAMLKRLLIALKQGNNLTSGYPLKMAKDGIFVVATEGYDVLLSKHLDQAADRALERIKTMNTITESIDYEGLIHPDIAGIYEGIYTTRAGSLKYTPKLGSLQLVKSTKMDYLSLLGGGLTMASEILTAASKIDNSFDASTGYILFPLFGIKTEAGEIKSNITAYNAYAKIEKERKFTAILDVESFTNLTNINDSKGVKAALDLDTKNLYPSDQPVEDSSKTATAKQFFGDNIKAVPFQIKCIKE